MKARRASKSKSWCLICREKPQTVDSDSSDRETEMENAKHAKNEERNELEDKLKNEMEDKSQKTLEIREECGSITPALIASKSFSLYYRESGNVILSNVASCNDVINIECRLLIILSHIFECFLKTATDNIDTIASGRKSVLRTVNQYESHVMNRLDKENDNNSEYNTDLKNK